MTGYSFKKHIRAALVTTALAVTLWAPVAHADETIRLVTNKFLLPLYAKERPDLFGDLLAKQGIKVEWVEVQGAHAPAIAAVIGGSADVTFGGSTAVALTSAANGQDIVIAAMARPVKMNGGIAVQGDSPIRSVNDLRGKSVAVNRGGFGELTLVTALDKFKIPRSEVNFIFLSLDDGAAAFAAGNVDAYVTLSTRTQVLQKEYGVRLIFDVDKDLTLDENVVVGDTLSYVTTRKYADANKATLKKVFDAYIKLNDWLKQNPDEMFAIANRANRYQPKSYDAVKDQLKGDIWMLPATEKDLAQLQEKADFLVKNKVLPKQIDVRKYIVTY